MHSQKIHNKKLILPVLIFLAGCLALAAVLYHSYRTNLKQVRAVTELNAITYAERLQNDMNRGVAITDTLEEIVLSENGKIDNFQKVAGNLMTDFVQSIPPLISLYRDWVRFRELSALLQREMKQER